MASALQMSLKRVFLSTSTPSSVARRTTPALRRWASQRPQTNDFGLPPSEAEGAGESVTRKIPHGEMVSQPGYVEGLVQDFQLLPSKAKEPATWTILNQDNMSEGGRIKLWSDDYGTMNLDRHWLRDSCECSLCVDPHSGQKNFGSTDVPLEQRIESCRRTEDGSLEIVWKNDFVSRGSHVSTYPRIWEARADGKIKGDAKTVTPHLREVLWDKKIIERDITFINYKDWINSDDAVAAGLRSLRTHGLIFLQNVPENEESVAIAAKRIGNLQDTLYGRTWDVRSKPEAENVAYTSSFLGLHQDMLYLHEPPRLQLLHCIHNSCKGGESLFSDASRAAHVLRASHPKEVHNLRQRRIKYHYQKGGHSYQRYRPVIASLSPAKVFWSPPFQGPRTYREAFNEGPGQTWRSWVQSATMFRQLLEQERWLYQYKMRQGDCAIFDNLRVVHGRRAFDTSGGQRFLKGTYVSQDVYDSKSMALGLGSASNEEDVPAVQEQAKRLSQKHREWIADAEQVTKVRGL